MQQKKNYYQTYVVYFSTQNYYIWAWRHWNNILYSS